MTETVQEATPQKLEAVGRMEEAFDAIVNWEFAWDQEEWRTGTEETACGTAMCFAGWAVSQSKYTPLIESPSEFAKSLPGGWDMLERDMESSVYSMIRIPLDDDLANNEYASEPSRYSTYYAHGEVADKLRAMIGEKPNYKVLEVSVLANALLDVRDYTGNPGGILEPSAFDGANRLATIRHHIDSARLKIGLEPRDFTEQPVQLMVDEWVPDDQIPDQEARIASFNERAVRGDVRTDREVKRDDDF